MDQVDKATDRPQTDSRASIVPPQGAWIPAKDDLMYSRTSLTCGSLGLPILDARQMLT